MSDKLTRSVVEDIVDQCFEEGFAPVRLNNLLAHDAVQRAIIKDARAERDTYKALCRSLQQERDAAEKVVSDIDGWANEPHLPVSDRWEHIVAILREVKREKATQAD